MKKTIFIFPILFLILFCSCSSGSQSDIPDGATTINGTYEAEKLPVGYFFSADGFGLQFIGDQQYQIKYYISDGKISIENFSVEGGNKSVFPFENCKSHIIIDGIKYNLIILDDISHNSNISS